MTGDTYILSRVEILRQIASQEGYAPANASVSSFYFNIPNQTLGAGGFHPQPFGASRRCNVTLVNNGSVPFTVSLDDGTGSPHIYTVVAGAPLLVKKAWVFQLKLDGAGAVVAGVLSWPEEVDPSAFVIAGTVNVTGTVNTINENVYGNGSDGAAVLDGTTQVAWATLAGSTYSMTRNAQLVSLTINSGVTLYTNGDALNAGYQIFCQTFFLNNGTVNAMEQGGLGRPGAAGQNGFAGGTGDALPSYNGLYASGGGGGSGTAVLFPAAGGNGGQGGGVVWVTAVDFINNGSITVAGQAGANGSAGATGYQCSGGGGGGGGVAFIAYARTLIGAGAGSGFGQIDISGGAGGTGVAGTTASYTGGAGGKSNGAAGGAHDGGSGTAAVTYGGGGGGAGDITSGATINGGAGGAGQILTVKIA